MSHSLSHQMIDEAVRLTSPGSFSLGHLEGGIFIAFYVGRADSDVNARLHAWVGVDGGSARYRPAASAAYATRHRRSPLPAPALGAVGVVADSGYTHFEFSYAPSAQRAFEGECRAYHDSGGGYGSLDNAHHPVAPDGAAWVCPAPVGGGQR